MIRLQVTSVLPGPANFTFGINPNFYNPMDAANVNKVNILHGADCYQEQAFDSRVRTMSWSRIPVNNTDMDEIITYFRGIEGEIRYFDFNDIATLNYRWPTEASSADWNKAQIITIKTTPAVGGSLIYDKVELLLQPEKI